MALKFVAWREQSSSPLLGAVCRPCAEVTQPHCAFLPEAGDHDRRYIAVNHVFYASICTKSSGGIAVDAVVVFPQRYRNGYAAVRAQSPSICVAVSLSGVGKVTCNSYQSCAAVMAL